MGPGVVVCHSASNPTGNARALVAGQPETLWHLLRVNRKRSGTFCGLPVRCSAVHGEQRVKSVGFNAAEGERGLGKTLQGVREHPGDDDGAPSPAPRASAWPLGLQEFGERLEGRLGCLKAGGASHGGVRNRKFNLAAKREIGRHNFEKRPCVDSFNAGLADSDGKPCFSHGPDEHRGRAGVQADRR